MVPGGRSLAVPMRTRIAGQGVADPEPSALCFVA